MEKMSRVTTRFFFQVFFLIRSVQILQQCLLSFGRYFPSPAVPDLLNQYILCDETNSSSINDSKRDVAPKWVDLPSVPWCIVPKPLRAAFGWMKAKKKRMLKIFIATDIYFSHCLPVNQHLKSNSEKRLIIDGENGKCSERDWCDFGTYQHIQYGAYMTNYLSSNKDHKSLSCSSSCNSTWKDSLLHCIKHCTCSGHLH